MTIVGQGADVVILIEPWAGTGYAKVRITPGYREQLQELLTEAHIDNSLAMEFSADSAAMELISVLVGSSVAWAAVGGAVKAFVGRNAEKRVRTTIAGAPIDLQGHGGSEAESLIRTIAAELYELREAEWQQMLRHHSQSTDPEPSPEA